MSTDPDRHTGTPNGTVTVPVWIATDWTAGTLLAVRGLAVLLIAGVVALAVEVLSDQLVDGPVAYAGGDAVVTPFAWPLGQLGVYPGSPVVLTALVLFGAGVRWALHRTQVPAGGPARLLALAVKTALVAVAALLVVAVLVDVLELSPLGNIGGPMGFADGPRPDYVRLVFLGGAVLTLSAAVPLMRHARLHLAGLLGISGELPTAVTASWTGLARTVRIAGVGLVVLFAFGATLEIMSTESTGFGQRLANASQLLVANAVLSAVDVAAGFLVAAMSFLQTEVLGPPTAWKWAGVALVAAAFFLGGRTAAATSRPATQVQAVLATSLLGLTLSLAYAVIAINYTAIGGLGGFAVPAILLPLPWTLVAAAGAWVWSNEQGLPSGVAVAVDETTSGVPPPGSPRDTTVEPTEHEPTSPPEGPRGPWTG